MILARSILAAALAIPCLAAHASQVFYIGEGAANPLTTALSDAGHEVTIGPQEQAFAGDIPAGTELIWLAPNPQGSNDLNAAAQLAITQFVQNGGGLVFDARSEFRMSAANRWTSLKAILPISSYTRFSGTGGIEHYREILDPVLGAGLPDPWSHATSTSGSAQPGYAVPKAGATVFFWGRILLTQSLQPTVVGWAQGLGRVLAVHFWHLDSEFADVQTRIFADNCALWATSSRTRFIALQNDSTGSVSYWRLTPNNVGQTVTAFPNGNVATNRIVGAADFNGDGVTDLGLYNPANRVSQQWLINTPTPVLQAVPRFNTTRSSTAVPVGYGDFNRDGRPDILFFNGGINRFQLETFRGFLSRSFVTLPIAGFAGHTIRGCGDFDGDGHPDILFQNDSTGALRYYEMNGSAYVATRTISTAWPAAFQVRGVGDVTGDGKADVIGHNPTTRAVILWSINADDSATSFNVGTAPADLTPKTGATGRSREHSD